MKQLGLFFSIALLFVACQNKKENGWQPAGKIALEASVNSNTSYYESVSTPTFVRNIEQAHQLHKVQHHEAISFDIELYFGGKLRVDATIAMLSNSGKIKVSMKDGTTITFDGSEVFLSPADSKYAKSKARFDIFTWQYFFALPYKLSDPGTNWKVLGTKKMGAQHYQAGRLTFGKDIGDAPDDWYVVYADPENHLIQAAAYIVTFSQSATEASKDPHAIIYKDYQTIQGVPVATTWEFTGWNEETGIKGKLGNATLSNIKFISAAEANFEVPENSVKVDREG